MYRNMKLISTKCNTDIGKLLSLSKNDIKIYLCPYDDNIQNTCNFIRELLLLKEGELLINLDDYNFLILLYDLCTR